MILFQQICSTEDNNAITSDDFDNKTMECKQMMLDERVEFLLTIVMASIRFQNQYLICA